MEKLMNSYSVTSKRNQVLVFCSNIDTKEAAALICNKLLKVEGVYKATIDLEDWENILRLESNPSLSIHEIEKTIINLGFECSELQ